MSIFMQIEGTQGESSDAGHKGWIDLESVGWGAKRKITSATSTRNDRESSNATITDLLIVRRMDSATPKLFMEACCGRGKEIRLHLTKAGSGSGADIYMEYVLKNALISHYQAEAEAQETERPVEKLIISFVEAEVKYIPYDQDGVALAPIAVGFDTATNTRK